MHRIVSDAALDALFRAAHSHYAWLERPVGDTLLRALYELVKRGPSGVARPARLVFVRSAEAKARLAGALPAALRPGLANAPVAAIVGCPREPGRLAAGGREGGLQAACLILAARALGLDCGPFWEFDAGIVEAAFFPDGTVAAIALCALGYGDETQPAPAEPRQRFDEACAIL